jgi:hypothetical protein
VTLVDTSVLLDIFANDAVWKPWSKEQLDLASFRGSLLINDVVYAELSVGFPGPAELDGVLAGARVMLTPVPRDGLFLAGKAFRQYRRSGGPRAGALPDFFIGAHASVLGIPLLTRDHRRYRHWFPALQVITPSA